MCRWAAQAEEVGHLLVSSVLMPVVLYCNVSVRLGPH